jgi:hypothetical protein
MQGRPNIPGAWGIGLNSRVPRSEISPVDTVKFFFWRPQRPAIPGAESGEYVDMGKRH